MHMFHVLKIQGLVATARAFGLFYVSLRLLDLLQALWRTMKNMFNEVERKGEQRNELHLRHILHHNMKVLMMRTFQLALLWRNSMIRWFGWFSLEEKYWKNSVPAPGSPTTSSRVHSRRSGCWESHATATAIVVESTQQMCTTWYATCAFEERGRDENDWHIFLTLKRHWVLATPTRKNKCWGCNSTVTFVQWYGWFVWHRPRF